MADKHPYAMSLSGLVQTIEHLRASFPAVVNADALKKLGYAPQNESYVINTLRFLGVIDDEGKETKAAEDVFSRHEDKDFQQGFDGLLRAAYKDLFDLRGEGAGILDKDKLITFFRQSDKSSAEVGRRQANTFIALAEIAGLRDAAELKAEKKPAAPRQKKEAKKAKIKPEPPSAPADESRRPASSHRRDFGLTVRIEINLPTEASQQTYDNIFKSIKANLLNE